MYTHTRVCVFGWHSLKETGLHHLQQSDLAPLKVSHSLSSRFAFRKGREEDGGAGSLNGRGWWEEQGALIVECQLIKVEGMVLRKNHQHVLNLGEEV